MSIAELYTAHGPDALAGLVGEYVLACIDHIQMKCYVSRDPAGARVGYILEERGAVHFASSVALLPNDSFPLPLDIEAAGQFLHYLYVPMPRTLYKGISVLLPGEMLCWDTHNVTRTFWYPRVKDSAAEPSHDRENGLLLEELDTLLSASMQTRLPPGGTACLLMSSGKDSTALAIASKHLGLNKLNALTIAPEGCKAGQDESDDAKRIAASLSIQHRIERPSISCCAQQFWALVPAMDQPFCDPSLWPMAACLNKTGDALFLDGTGGDDYFGMLAKGLTKCSYALDWNPLKTTARLCNDLVRLLRRRPSYRLDILSRPRPELFVSWNGWDSRDVRGFCGKPVAIPASLFQEISSFRPRNASSLKTCIEDAIWLPQAALRKTVWLADQNGFGISFPYLDSKLAKFVRGLPAHLRYRGSTNKVLLRAYLQDRLPSALHNLPKRGFIFPAEKMFLYDGGASFLSLVERSREWAESVGFDLELGLKCFEQYQRGATYLGQRVYSLATLLLWLDTHVN